MTLSHKTCMNTSGKGSKFKKTLFAINAIFTSRVFFSKDSIDSE